VFFCGGRSSGAAALMFAGEGTTLAAAGAGRTSAGASPLLILTNDRQYTIAPAPGADAAEIVSDVPSRPLAGESSLNNRPSIPTTTRPNIPSPFRF